jgi:hypothetical protein
MSVYSGARRNRCSDKFIKLPYPKTLYSEYMKDFGEKLKHTNVISKDDAFNLEKEAKIINPHRMDLQTTHSSTFQNFKVIPTKKDRPIYKDESKPLVSSSSYQKNFPNWLNGNNDVFHEKAPVYPFYSLPFRGGSFYKEQFSDEQQQKLKEHKKMLAMIGLSNSFN